MNVKKKNVISKRPAGMKYLVDALAAFASFVNE